MGSSETLVEAALRVLTTADPFEKARLGDQVANQWLQGLISLTYHPSQDFAVPDRPARLTNVGTLRALEMCLWFYCFRVLHFLQLFYEMSQRKVNLFGAIESKSDEEDLM